MSGLIENIVQDNASSLENALSSEDVSFQDCEETADVLDDAEDSFTRIKTNIPSSPSAARVDSRNRNTSEGLNDLDDDAELEQTNNSNNNEIIAKYSHYPMRPASGSMSRGMGRFVRRGSRGGLGGSRWGIGRSIHSGDNNVSSYQYPLLYVSPAGTISVLLKNDIIVELTIDKALRVTSPGRFAASTNGRGSASCIMHTQARIYQEDAKVFSQFGSDKLAVFGSQGVLFTMRRLTQAYLVSASNIGGTTAIPLSCIQFPTLESDFTLTLFYMQSQFGERCVSLCQEMVHSAHYESRPDGTLVVHINGIYIRQDVNGRVDVNNRPRHISVNPHDSSVHLRTHSVDMFIQDDEKAYIKRGEKRMHVSRSGMVVSDGNCITSMDHFGRIVSST